jgi:hypothetical protein
MHEIPFGAVIHALLATHTLAVDRAHGRLE